MLPEIITGLSLLLLFVAMDQLIGWPAGRGVTTITIAHISFSLSYVAVIVQARLVGFDESLEEAALDLGAKPATVFTRITLPLIAPALLSGWLLSFTLSWDDVVISQFVAGPGSVSYTHLARTGHCARRVHPAQRAADAGDPAVLDLLPAAHLCLDRAVEGRRTHQQPAAGSAPDPRADPDGEYLSLIHI